MFVFFFFFFFQAEDGIRDLTVTGVQTCALPISVKVSHCGTERISGVASPTNGANASTEFVVPRSIPIEKRALAIVKSLPGGPALFRADLAPDFPSAIGIRVLHPELKDSEFRDDRVDTNRHHLPRRDVVDCRDLDFEHAGVLKFTFGIRKYLSRRVAASHGGGEESELRWTAGNKTELASLDQQFRAFLHALREDAQRFRRRLVARNGEHRGLQADVIGPRCAGLNAYALAGSAVTPVDRGPPCDGEVRLETLPFPA